MLGFLAPQDASNPRTDIIYDVYQKTIAPCEIRRSNYFVGINSVAGSRVNAHLLRRHCVYARHCAAMRVCVQAVGTDLGVIAPVSFKKQTHEHCVYTKHRDAARAECE